MSSQLAIEGGAPVRASLLPYGRQSVDDEDIQAVVGVLRSDWLTTGPEVPAFEREFARVAGTAEAVAVANGTAALHCAFHALCVRGGDEVIVTPITFAATANAAVYCGARPIFADVDQETLLIDPKSVERSFTDKTKAIAAVDYAGQPCDYDALSDLAARHHVKLLSDACHALGAAYRDRPIGSLADVSGFSLHPVKPITTGEGGVVTTDDPELAAEMRAFRAHGIRSDFRQREAQGSWFYEMTELGYNYRITDFQCALGKSQLTKLPTWVARRQAIAAAYDGAFADLDGVRPLAVRSDRTHAYHLYVVLLDLEMLRVDRTQIFRALRAENIGVNVHYIPVHLHPYYRQTFGTGPGLCPVAEAAYERMLSLPVFPAMTDQDIQDVIDSVHKVVSYYRR